MSDNPGSDRDDFGSDPSSGDDELGFGEGSDAGVQDEQERRLEEMEQRLERKEAELDEREQRLDREESELEGREDELLERREEVVSLRENVESLETEIDNRKQRLDEREAAIEEQERELDERKAELAEVEQTLQTYVADQIDDLEGRITQTVRDAVRSSMSGIEGGGGVDEERLTTTVRQSVESAIAQEDLEERGTAFGAVLGSLLAFLGILLVAGGVANGLVTFVQTDTVNPLFAQSSINYIVSSILVIIGFAANLAAAAGRV
jgi:uncharacterized protein (DUF3084 family)